MTDASNIPRSFYWAPAILFPAAIAGMAVSWSHQPPVLSWQLALLLIATIISENFAYALPLGSISLAYPLTMAGIVWGGPAVAALVAAVSSTNYEEIRSHRPPSMVAFNFGQLVLFAVLGGWVYQFFGGIVLLGSNGFATPLGSDAFPHILLPMTLTAMVCVAGNMAMTALGFALLKKGDFSPMLRSMLPFAPTQIALAFVGYMVAQVLAISIFALPLFVAPLFVARQLYQRYSSLRAAYVDTIRSLVGALEAKDPYTKGHSERVSRYSAALGAEMGLDSQALQRLEYAALLHDLGKLAVPGRILTKPGVLDADEMELIRSHPVMGAEMIGRIPPLRDLAPTVAQHHERVDGSGYPGIVGGADMSQSARILAVADSFDAMTTTRAYRPAMSPVEAENELLAGAGTQFDDEVVACFVRLKLDVDTSDGSGLGPAGVTS